jgi:hypothetical protein
MSAARQLSFSTPLRPLLHLHYGTRPSPELTAYRSYQAYCRLLKEKALNFDSWRVQSQRIFGSALNHRPREANPIA